MSLRCNPVLPLTYVNNGNYFYNIISSSGSRARPKIAFIIGRSRHKAENLVIKFYARLMKLNSGQTLKACEQSLWDSSRAS